jgi:hypothetical protein
MHKFCCEEISPNNYNKKLNILLDLDNTIINALDTEELLLVPEDFQKNFKYYDMMVQDKFEYRVFERPHVQLFLDYIFLNYNVSIFTAADKDYALFIYENVIKREYPANPIKNRKINYFFCGTHSSYSEILYGSPKNLELLWSALEIHHFKPCNTIIIDDLHEVVINNPRNCIEAPKFEIVDNGIVNYNADKDNFLITTAIKEIEKHRNELQNNPCITHSDPQNYQYCERVKSINSSEL